MFFCGLLYLPYIRRKTIRKEFQNIYFMNMSYINALKGIEYSMKINDIRKFEKQIKILINVQNYD